MRKTPEVIILCTLFISHAQADEQKAGKKDQSTFSELSRKLIENREERLELISIALKCINSANHINQLNFCAEAEMSAIHSRMDKFCQSPIKGIQRTHDYKVFCGNKPPAHIEGK